MRKELPLENPLIETYQGESFVLAVMMSYKNTRNVVFNNYINLSTNISTMDLLRLHFLNSTWENYRREGYSSITEYWIRSLEEDSFGDLLRGLIDEDNYLLVFGVDDFYLPHTELYNKEHNLHDIYLYGYEDDQFMALAYNGNHLSRIMVDLNNLKKSLFKRKIDENDNVVCSYKVADDVYVDLDINRIISELKDYLAGVGYDSVLEPDKAGVDIYDEIIKALKKYAKRKRAFFDLRVFRALWEHKKLMTYRIAELEPYLPDEELLNRSKELEGISRKLFLLSMKHSLKNDKEDIEEMISIVETIREKDIAITTSLIEKLSDSKKP
ncbi:MAG: hypothetical protein IKX68_09520 [Clostridiales bacterium]|nr:hypothetical protein [Clostridiales bacterium]